MGDATAVELAGFSSEVEPHRLQPGLDDGRGAALASGVAWAWKGGWSGIGRAVPACEARFKVPLAWGGNRGSCSRVSWSVFPSKRDFFFLPRSKTRARMPDALVLANARRASEAHSHP